METLEFIAAFALAKIPTPCWKPLTPAKDGTVYFTQCSNIMRGKQQVDFTYFKTVVNVTGKVNDFKVTFGEVDDAAAHDLAPRQELESRRIRRLFGLDEHAAQMRPEGGPFKVQKAAPILPPRGRGTMSEAIGGRG